MKTFCSLCYAVGAYATTGSPHYWSCISAGFEPHSTTALPASMFYFDIIYFV